jgi:hypothetical protein
MDPWAFIVLRGLLGIESRSLLSQIWFGVCCRGCGALIHQALNDY